MARLILAGVVATFILAVVQATLGARLSLAGVPPDLPFIWTVCAGLLGGPRVGMVIGFGSGILEGSLHQSMTASLSISKGASGLAAGLLGTKLFRENWLVPAAAGGLLTVANEVVFLVLSGPSMWAGAGKIVLGRMVYHAVLTPIAFWLVLRARQALVGQSAEVN